MNARALLELTILMDCRNETKGEGEYYEFCPHCVAVRAINDSKEIVEDAVTEIYGEPWWKLRELLMAILEGEASEERLDAKERDS